MLEIIFNTVLIMSLIGSAIWLLLITFQNLTKKIFSLNWQYYMRLVVILFMIIPVGILGGNLYFKESKIEQNNFYNSPIYKSNNYDYNYSTADTPKLNTNNDIPKYNFSFSKLKGFLPYIWLLGVLIFSVYKLIQFIIFKQKLLMSSTEVKDITILNLLKECRFEVWVKNIDLIYNKFISTPMISGLVKPKLFLPDIELDDNELNFIFKHELIHFKRKDLIFKLIALVANIIHWFNPISYLIIKDIDNLCELSCDELLVNQMDESQRYLYGETILNVISKAIDKNNSIHASLCSSKKGIERRLDSMLNSKQINRHCKYISLLVGFSILILGFNTVSIAHASITSQLYKSNKTASNNYNNLDSYINNFDISDYSYDYDFNVNNYSNKSTNNYNNYNDSNKTTFNIDGNSISEVYIDCSLFGNIDIQKSNTNHFELTASKKTSTNTENGILSIDSEDSIILKIPDKIYTNFEILTKLGSIHLPNIKGDIYAKTNVGNITVKDTKLSESSLNLVSNTGTINVKADMIQSDLDIDNNTGTINIDINTINNNLSAESNTGTIYIKTDKLNSDVNLHGNYSNMELNFDTKPSNLKLDIDDYSKFIFFKELDKDYSIGSGNPIISIDNLGGTIKVNYKGNSDITELTNNNSYHFDNFPSLEISGGTLKKQIDINIPDSSVAKKIKYSELNDKDSNIKFCIYGPIYSDKKDYLKISLSNDIKTKMVVATSYKNDIGSGDLMSNTIGDGYIEGNLNTITDGEGKYYIFVGAKDFKNLNGTIEIYESDSYDTYYNSQIKSIYDSKNDYPFDKDKIYNYDSNNIINNFNTFEDMKSWFGNKNNYYDNNNIINNINEEYSDSLAQDIKNWLKANKSNSNISNSNITVYLDGVLIE